MTQGQATNSSPPDVFAHRRILAPVDPPASPGPAW